MEMEPFENPWIKKIRGLTHLLILSIGVNVGLGTTLLYQRLKWTEERGEDFSRRVKEVVLKDSSGDVLRRYFECSEIELIGELDNKELVQDGLSKRDLALACLVNFHYFDIEKALSGTVLQRRELSFIHHGGGEKFDLQVFPGLDETQYQMLLAFAKREEWPLTAEGLFGELLHGKEKDSPGLKKAFMATPEYFAIFTAFKRFGEEISKEKILQLILEGSWQTIETFRKKQTVESGISLELLREFLKGYIALGSKEAASLWIKMEPEYILRHFSDENLLQIIKAIGENTLSTNLFLKKLLSSVRSDRIREASGKKLYEFKEGKAPEVYKHEEAMRLFLPSLFVEKEPKIVEVKKEIPCKIHRVIDGDSLWKISKQYKVSIEDLRAKNHLKNDRLHPGQEILIP
jgi:LysM repeat protein